MSTNRSGSSNRPQQQRTGNRPTANRPQPNNGRPGPIRTSGSRPPQRNAPSGPNPALVVGGIVVVLLLIVGVIFLLTNLSNANTASQATPTTAAVVASGAPAGGPSTAVVETSKGTFKIHLYTDDASVANTVKNFQTKAQSGYFDGKTFHRVEDWVIQGGDPLGTGTGGGSMPGEYNSRSFTTGAVGMASTGAKSAQVNDSQWFVVKSDATYLDGQYSNFGMVTDGMDVVNKIAIGDLMTKITMEQ